MKFQMMVVSMIFLFANSRNVIGEDAAELQRNGIAALKDSQTNPDAIVTAARCFAKASALYEASGKTELAVEMNSYLYWCKKKMTMAQIDSFLKSGETTVANRLAATEDKPVAPSEAQAWMDRAAAFERWNRPSASKARVSKRWLVQLPDAKDRYAINARAGKKPRSQAGGDLAPSAVPVVDRKDPLRSQTVLEGKRRKLS